ncbi:MAG: hypothetical protein A3G85_01070 [Elusimicrobia bacterium RIFCSPLOWO2_12_FULL_39_28]|nr:MAG: hypothetical protein A3G85_01070 [Elusimicrobia bacterium RIFCSPLOWO2_12_FULL_39_28]
MKYKEKVLKIKSALVLASSLKGESIMEPTKKIRNKRKLRGRSGKVWFFSKRAMELRKKYSIKIKRKIR